MPKQNSRRSHGIRGRLTAKTLPPLLACAWLLPGCDDSGPDAAPQESAQTASANPNANTNATDDDNPAGGRSNPAVSKLIGELRPEGLVSDPLPPSKSPGAAPRSVDTDPPPAAEPEPTTAERVDRPSDKVLTQEFETMVVNLVAALSSGDLKAAGAILLSEADLKKVLTDGTLTVLGSQLPTKNRDILQSVIGVTGGKKVRHEHRTGKLTSDGPRGAAFRVSLPMISGARLQLEIEGTPVPIVIDLQQSLWIDGRWRIFNLEI